MNPSRELNKFKLRKKFAIEPTQINLVDVDDEYLRHFFDALFRVGEQYIYASDESSGTTGTPFSYELYRQWRNLLEGRPNTHLSVHKGIYIKMHKQWYYPDIILHQTDDLKEPYKLAVKLYSRPESISSKTFKELYRLITCESTLSEEGVLYGVTVLICRPEEKEKAIEAIKNGIKWFITNHKKSNLAYVYAVIYDGTNSLLYIQPNSTYCKVTKDSI